MTGHWHDHNPWGERATYVPIEELAGILSGGTVREVDGSTVERTPEWLMKHWRQYGEILDAYILPDIRDPRFNAIGIRYGKDGSSYLSVHNSNPDEIERLLETYGTPSPSP